MPAPRLDPVTRARKKILEALAVLDSAEANDPDFMTPGMADTVTLLERAEARLASSLEPEPSREPGRR